jgi:hypothetical protein
LIYRDKEKLERLTHTFDLNYRITSLYAMLLERFPELISREMVDELCSDGRINREEAIAAILCEAFGLDDAGGGDDRRLIRDYIRPSVRVLDPKKYTENKYYKNIRIDNVMDGDWELRQESYAPYRAIICGDIIINDDYSEIPPLGFFPEEFRFPAVLEGGNEWMTLTPVDLDTCEEAIGKARGKVITFGLGLGYFAYMASEKDEVESVTVIEKSPEVIALFRRHILPQFSNREKINIICADAFEYARDIMPGENYTYAFVDTWRDASDGAPMYERMKQYEPLSPGTEFDYWIENFLISRLRALRFEELYRRVEAGEADAPQNFEEFIERLNNGKNI